MREAMMSQISFWLHRLFLLEMSPSDQHWAKGPKMVHGRPGKAEKFYYFSFVTRSICWD
ncbi:hypothetical protein Syun_011869 [Stephania yunnanensis]|uniref:Uncharacterized protein n=1 Tax=Stephania yunnanensis TaxID=152371 RepID=A0AAP0JZ39_9MAGN